MILEIAESRRSTDVAELQQILRHVAGQGFHPTETERVRGRLAGMDWQGRIIRSGREMLPSAEVKYLWHVMKRREWPAGTTLDAYIVSIRDVIVDPTSGALINRGLAHGLWQSLVRVLSFDASAGLTGSMTLHSREGLETIFDD